MGAIPNDYITTVVGMNIKAGNFATPAQTLPVQIALLGEANTSMNSAVDETTPKLVLTKKEMGDLAGYGSLPHIMFDYLQNLRVPITWYPQKYDTGTPPTATVHTMTITGTATAASTHNIVINGRKYPINIVVGDSEPTIGLKILDAVNGIIDAPVIADDANPGISYTTKWKGKTSAGLKVRVEAKNLAGISYSFAIVAGTGTPVDIATSLARFGSTWNTIVVNPYGEDAFSALETFNGVCGAETPSGRWDPVVGLPFIALFGSNISDKDDAAALTNTSTRKAQMTNIACPSPNSEWFPCEAAASYALTYGTIANETPHLGLCNKSLSFSIPPVGGLGDMVDVAGRNAIAKYGHSTADYINGNFQVKDFISTYHPDGEMSPKWREARDIMVDMNILFYIKLVMARDILSKVTTADSSITNVANMISVVDIKAIITSAIYDLAKLGFIATPETSIASLVVTINPSYRASIAFNYQRTSELKQTGADVSVDFFTVI